MSEAICEKNLARYRDARIWEGETPFCLAQVSAYETENATTRQKVEILLEGRTAYNSQTSVERVCNLGGCTLKITEDLETGRIVSGQCKAARYCLKTAFEAVGQAPTAGEGKALYKEIIETLEGHSDKYNAGNFCPRFDCGLSAGVTIDGNPGTAGHCVKEITQDQQQIDFGQTA